VPLSIQLANQPGIFDSPRLDDTNFVCDLLGVSTRKYRIEWSPDLSSWNNLATVTNLTGSVTFTNSAGDAARFYRALLLP
jgi:hypothetical protein